MTEYFDTNVNAGMKTAEEILKSKLNPSVAILNNPEYTFNKVIESMEEYADQFKHLHLHGVMQGLPTENEIRAQALLMENKFDNYTAKIIARASYESGARWVISKLSGSPAVASSAVGSQTSARTCATRCDWPNCTLDGCAQ